MLFGFRLAINYQLLILENSISISINGENYYGLWIMDMGLNMIDFIMDIMEIYVLIHVLF